MPRTSDGAGKNMGPILRWMLRAVFSSMITLGPKFAVLWVENRLTWETIRGGPDFVNFAMTLSLTSLIDILVVKEDGKSTGLTAWGSPVAAAFASLVRRPRFPDGGRRRGQPLVPSRRTDQGIPLRMVQRIDGEVDVEIRPVQMMRTW